jgi:hypothetical protein
MKMVFENMDNRRFSALARAWAFPAFILALLLIVLARLSLREDYWMDEASTVRRVAASWSQLYAPFSFVPASPVQPFDTRDVYDLNPPLYFALARLAAGPAPSRLALRLFSIVSMILGLAILAAWARSALGVRAQFAILLIGSLAPATLYFGFEARPYALPFAVACLLIWLGARLEKRPGRLMAACAAGAAAGCLSNFAFAWWNIGFWMLSGMALIQAREDGDRMGLRSALAVMAGLAAGALAALLAIVPQWEILRWCRIASSRVLWPNVLMSSFAAPFCRVGVRPVPPLAGACLQAAILVVFCLLYRRSSRRRLGLVALALWLIPLALPVMMKSCFNIPYYERYAFFAMAGWLMTLGWIAQESADRRGWPRGLIAVLLGAILVTCVAWTALNMNHPLRQEWRPIVRRLEQNARPGDAYGFDPDFLKVTYASNARKAPCAEYLDYRDAVPSGVRTLWIVSDGLYGSDGRISLQPGRWRIERVERAYLLDLYRATRLSE